MRMGYRILSVLLGSALVTGGMVAGWYGWQNHQGNQRWMETRRALEARGEILDPRAFIPPMVPDAQNLAFAPWFVRLYQYKPDPATGLVTFQHGGNVQALDSLNAMPYGSQGAGQAVRPSGPNWMSGRAVDLAALQQYFWRRTDFPRAPQPQTPAEDVRLALTRFDPSLDELARAAAARPLGRFPVNWTQQPASAIWLPHDNCVQVLVSTLRLRATASLALGRSGEALNDVLLGLRLMRTIEAEPMMISNLVDVTCVGLLMQPVWEGLAAHRWNPAQLATLQAELGRIDLIRDFARTCRAERAVLLLPLLDDLDRQRNFNQVLNLMEMTEDRSTSSRSLALLIHLFPSGWFAEAKAVTCQLDQRGVLDPMRPAMHRILPREVDAGAAEVRRLPLSTNTFLAKVLLPVSSSVTQKIAQGQAVVDEAMVACAAERYFLEHRAYPEKLAELVPTCIERIPPDVIDGAPMRYQRTPEGSFRLWEVGWNGVDEGGKVVMAKGATKPDARSGDWVWQYTAVPNATDGPTGGNAAAQMY